MGAFFLLKISPLSFTDPFLRRNGSLFTGNVKLAMILKLQNACSSIWTWEDVITAIALNRIVFSFKVLPKDVSVQQSCKCLDRYVL